MRQPDLRAPAHLPGSMIPNPMPGLGVHGSLDAPVRVYLLLIGINRVGVDCDEVGGRLESGACGVFIKAGLPLKRSEPNEGNRQAASRRHRFAQTSVSDAKHRSWPNAPT